MKKRKWIPALLLIVSLLSGCSGGGSRDGIIIMGQAPEAETGERVDLTFFGFKEGSWNVLAIENALHGFMDLHPGVNIAYEGNESAEYWTLLEKRVETGNMDDIVMLDHDHILSLSAEGQLADLSDLSTISYYNETAQSQFPKDSPLYFLPTCISTYGLYINRDLLEAHGRKIPENLDEFAAVCDYFVSQGITPIVGNNYSSLRCLMAAKGLYPVYQSDDPAEEIRKINAGETDLAALLKPGVELAGMMLEKGWFDSEELASTGETWDEQELFAAGDRPFMVAGGWVSASLNAKGTDFDYGVYPFPILDDGSVLVQDVNTCIGVSAGCDDLETAKSLVEYLTQPDVMWAYCDNQNSFTPLTDDRTLSDPALAPSAPYLTNGRSVIGSDYNLTLPIDHALKECGDKMLAGMAPADAAACLEELLCAPAAE